MRINLEAPLGPLLSNIKILGFSIFYHNTKFYLVVIYIFFSCMYLLLSMIVLGLNGSFCVQILVPALLISRN
jgi:hypothetical protein